MSKNIQRKILYYRQGIKVPLFIVVVVVVVVVVVRTRPRAIPLAMIAIRKTLHGFPFLSRDAYGAPLGGAFGPPELR